MLIWSHVTCVVIPGQGLLSILVQTYAHCSLPLIASLLHCCFHSYCVTSRGRRALSAGTCPTLGTVRMTVSHWAEFLCARISPWWRHCPHLVSHPAVESGIYFQFSATPPVWAVPSHRRYTCRWCHRGGLCVLRDMVRLFPRFTHSHCSFTRAVAVIPSQHFRAKQKDKHEK